MADDLRDGARGAPAPDGPAHRDPHPDVAGFVLGVLDPADAAAFDAHLRGCARCQADVRDLQPLTSALDQAAPAVELPPGLAARTFAAVERAAASDDRPSPHDDRPASIAGLGAGSNEPAPDHDDPAKAPSGAPDHPGTAAPAEHPRFRHARAAGSSRNATARAALATAAAIAVAAAIVLVVGLWPSSGRGPDARVALVSDVAGRSGTVALRRTDAGVAIDLAVSGLAPPTGGAHYECWYLSPDDTATAPDRISAGTFTVDADGHTRVRMVTAADPAEYPRIVVTLQPAGGDPAAMGDAVLWSRWKTDRAR